MTFGRIGAVLFGARPFPGSGLYIPVPSLQARDTGSAMCPPSVTSRRTGSSSLLDRGVGAACARLERRCASARPALRRPLVRPRAILHPLFPSHPRLTGTRRSACPVDATFRVDLTRGILCVRTHPVNIHFLSSTCISCYPLRTECSRGPDPTCERASAAASTGPEDRATWPPEARQSRDSPRANQRQSRGCGRERVPRDRRSRGTLSPPWRNAPGRHDDRRPAICTAQSDPDA